MPALSLEPQQLECKKLRTSEEEKFLEAAKESRISESSLEDIKQPLRYAMVKVGLRAASFPTEEEKAVLIAHIIQNYGTHTPAEIRPAFDMAISGKLDVDPVCYENFSCLYFSSIMNAYRKWAVQVHDQVLRESQPYNEKQLGMKVHWGGEVNYYFQKLKKGQFVSYITYPLGLYTQMCEDGFIQHNPLFTDEQKKKAVFEQFEKDKERREVYYVAE